MNRPRSLLGALQLLLAKQECRLLNGLSFRLRFFLLCHISSFCDCQSESEAKQISDTGKLWQTTANSVSNSVRSLRSAVWIIEVSLMTDWLTGLLCHSGPALGPSRRRRPPSCPIQMGGRTSPTRRRTSTAGTLPSRRGEATTPRMHRSIRTLSCRKKEGKKEGERDMTNMPCLAQNTATPFHWHGAAIHNFSLHSLWSGDALWDCDWPRGVTNEHRYKLYWKWLDFPYSCCSKDWALDKM